MTVISFASKRNGGIGPVTQAERAAPHTPHVEAPQGDQKPKSARPPDPVEIIARAMDGLRARQPLSGPVTLDPAQIIAQALDLPHWRHGMTARPHALRLRPEPPPPPPKAEPAPRLPVSGEQSFWAVWMEHNEYLLRQSLRLLGGHRHNAEDALSTAMLRAAEAFSDSTITNHRAWLFRILHNVCMDQHRSRQRQPLAAEPADPEASSSAFDPFAAERSPEDDLLDHQLVRSVERALEGMPKSLAETLLLSLDDRSDAEIAEHLLVTREVVRKRRQIAREKLRRALLG